MSSVHEDKEKLEDKNGKADIVKANDETSVMDEVNNDLTESKSGRKIKPSHKISEKYEDNKKRKAKSHKKSEGKFKSKSSNNVDLAEPDVDKTAAVEVPVTTKAVCGYCHKGHLDDPLESGKMFSIAGVITHYFCMLFTYNSSQLGADNEGLFGFYGAEVKSQMENAQKRRCKYCSKPGATARCNKKHCGVYMHFPCGQEAGATFQFMGKMHTYCYMHRVRQKEETFPSPPDADCVICYEKVDIARKVFKRIRAPCCGRHLHRDCVQRFAMTSGTQHFKCPNCNNHELITKEFKKAGVYIPYKDAEWELPAQSSFYNFQDMYVQTKRCSVKECLCKEKEGRSFNDVDGEFEIVLCDMCGTNGVHIKCAKVNEETLDYVCVDCGGDVALEERSFDSRNSSLNLSLASSVDNSLNSTFNTSEDDLNSEPEVSTSNEKESIPNIRDFIKQFELTSSSSNVSEPKTTTSEPISDTPVIEKVEDVSVPKVHKKRGPKSKTMNTPSSSDSPTMATEDSKSKHSFFKHTEEVTKMLEDLKKKEQEKKSKDAFFQSLTASHVTEKKVDNVKSLETVLDFGKYLAKSLGKERTDNDDMASITTSDDDDKKIEEIENKITNLSNTVIGGATRDITDEIVNKPVAPRVGSIRVRTDLLIVEDACIKNAVDMEEDIDIGNDLIEPLEELAEGREISEGMEISERRRNFGNLLLQKQGKTTKKKEGLSFIEYFYKKMAKPDPVTNSNKESTESPNRDLEKDENNTGNSNEVPFSAPESSTDIEITLDETEVSEESPADTSNLGIEIVDTYTCSDSFIDELLNSPVKNKEDEKTVDDAGVSPEEEVIVANDVLGSNIVHDSPISKANIEAKQGKTTKALEQEQAGFNKTDAVASKTAVNTIKDSIVPVVDDSNKHVPDLSPKPTKSPVILTEAPIMPSEVPTRPAVLPPVKPKAGPRSRTKPNEPPVTRTSPTKIKESIAENIKIFEEAIKLKSQDDVLNKMNDEEDSNKHKSDKEENKDVEPEPTVRYRPGPKSRKKYLIVKEDEALKDTKNESTKLSPKRALEISEDTNTKKQKTKDVTLEESSNLDSTLSSTGSNLEIIDLDASDISSQATAVPKIDTVAEGTSESKLATEKSSKNVEPTIIEETPSSPAINPSTPAVVSKRASKRPFQCPVCQGFFRAEMVLQQHLAKIHFWNRLMALPRETNMGSGEMFQCSEFPCRYLHKSKTIVAGHIATEHKVVFTIALSIFPDFKLPILPVTRAVTSTTEDSVTIVGTVPGRLPPVEPTPTPDHSSKRSHSLGRTDEEVNKKARPSALVRPVILPSQPTKAVARVKPRTALVQPIPSTPAESPLKPSTFPDTEKSYS